MSQEKVSQGADLNTQAAAYDPLVNTTEADASADTGFTAAHPAAPVSSKRALREDDFREKAPRLSRRERRAARPKPRSTSLKAVKLDPWSVFKYAFVYSIFLFLVWMGVTALLFYVLESLGVIASILDLSATALNADLQEKVASFLVQGNILKLSAAIGGALSLVFVVVLTLMALVHNVVSKITGGIAVTLKQ